MRVSNLKVKTPAIPSRSAANQFLAQNGYDMEWVPLQGLFYVHDIEKQKLHAIHMGEVTNFTLDVDPKAFMEQLRSALHDLPAALEGKLRFEVARGALAEEPPRRAQKTKAAPAATEA